MQKIKLNEIYCGDSLGLLKQLPDELIDCVVTSPPYWALRDYGVKNQLGLEANFENYINRLCDIFNEVKRVLKNTGTCWVNIGDTYYTKSGGAFLNDQISSKEKVKLTNLTKYLEKALEDMHNNLYKKAESLLKKNISNVDNMNNFKKAIDNKNIVYASWCENQKCEEDIKEKTGAKSLNIPLKQPNIKGKKCINCNKEAKLMLYFGKSY